MHNFQTAPIVFIAIVLGYLALSLVLGGKKAYFDSYNDIAEDPADPETAPAPSGATTAGAEPWQVGQKGSSSAPLEPTHKEVP